MNEAERKVLRDRRYKENRKYRESTRLRKVENVERGKLVWQKMKGWEMEKDIVIQARAYAVQVAEIARHYQSIGRYGALKSTSALVNEIVEDIYKMVLRESDQAPIQTTSKALEILEWLGLSPGKRSEGAIFRNLRKESLQSTHRNMESAKLDDVGAKSGQLDKDERGIQNEIMDAAREVFRNFTANSDAATESETEDEKGE